MKAVTITRYEAVDGSRFDTAAECKSYEKHNAGAALVGLTTEQVQAAISGNDPSLADAVERVAYQIAQRRREAGELKRRPRAKAAEAAPTTDTAEQGAPA